MAKIMLLDDSPVMHRVVRLTFADDPTMEIAVARTPDEAEQALGSGQTDLIIAYARFVGDSPVSYFEALSFASPRILLLAEADENMDPFVQSGFDAILRKPFHSDELRQAVEDLLAIEVQSHKEPRRQAPTPPPAPPSVAPRRSSAPTPPPAPPSATPRRSSAPTPPPAPPSATPRKSSPLSAEPKQPQDIEFPAGAVENEEITRELDEKSLNIKKTNSAENPNDSSGVKFEPQITLDLSGLRQLALETSVSQGKAQMQFSDTDDFAPSLPMSHVVAEKSISNPSSMAAGASSQRNTGRGIEPANWDDTPLALENVMVSTRMENHGLNQPKVHQLTQEEVETIVEERVASAVSRAVRQALNETLPELRQGVVNEVSQRAVEQISAELREIRQTLKNSMSAELKELSSQWLRRETPSLAKDVIREEIRRVIEAV